MDRKIRKLMTVNKTLHPKADVRRLYVSRENGGRGLMSVEECVRLEEQSLSDYLKKSNINEDSVMDDFLKDKPKNELKAEQRRKVWKDGRRRLFMVSTPEDVMIWKSAFGNG